MVIQVLHRRDISHQASHNMDHLARKEDTATINRAISRDTLNRDILRRATSKVILPKVTMHKIRIGVIVAHKEFVPG